MPQFDRGVYEPDDELRVFDGSEDDDIEGSRLPLLIVLALLVLAMFAGVVWLAYTRGVARGRTETPVLTAQNGPARVAPANPGGAQQPYKGFKIYEQPAPPDDDTDSTAAPAPATPAPAAAAPVKQVEAPPAKPAPVAAAPTKEQDALTKLAAAPAPQPRTEPKPVAVAKPAPVKQVAVEAPPSKPLPVAKPQPIGPATAAPRSLSATHSLAAAPPPAPVKSVPVAAAASSGGYFLQIGAYKSQADADTAWKSYKAKHTALLAAAAPDVQRVDLGDKGTWYRLRIAGFSNKDVASAMCDRLKSDGGGCFPAK